MTTVSAPPQQLATALQENSPLTRPILSRAYPMLKLGRGLGGGWVEDVWRKWKLWSLALS